jgi:hypothetical protein
MPRKKKVEEELLTGWYGVYGISGMKSYLPVQQNKSKSAAELIVLCVIGILTLGVSVLFNETNDGMRGRN